MSFHAAGAGDAVTNPLGGDVLFKLRGGESDGSMTAFETIVRPGLGPPLHVHPQADETLYVIEGDVRFKLGDELHDGGAGSFTFVPRGMPHAFKNTGDGPLRMLIHFTPSGMERFFEAFAAVESPGSGTFGQVAAEGGMEVVGPPL